MQKATIILLLSAKMATSIINPFKTIVDDLSSETWRKVTIEYLDWVHALLKPHKIPVATYGDVFRVLEYLYENKAVDLQNCEDYHLIRKGTNFG